MFVCVYRSPLECENAIFEFSCGVAAGSIVDWHCMWIPRLSNTHARNLCQLGLRMGDTETSFFFDDVYPLDSME